MNILVKIRTEIHEMENGKTIEAINETKTGLKRTAKLTSLQLDCPREKKGRRLKLLKSDMKEGTLL